MSKTHVVNGFLRKNPDGTLGSFRIAHPKTTVSSTFFYSQRRKLEGKDPPKIYQRKKIDYDSVDKFIKANPTATCVEYNKAHPNDRINESSYYRRKRKLSGARYVPVARNYTVRKIYTTIWTTDQKIDMSVLQDLIENLNKTCRLQLEIVELLNPKQIEVRRYTR